MPLYTVNETICENSRVYQPGELIELDAGRAKALGESVALSGQKQLPVQNRQLPKPQETRQIVSAPKTKAEIVAALEKLGKKPKEDFDPAAKNEVLLAALATAQSEAESELEKAGLIAQLEVAGKKSGEDFDPAASVDELRAKVAELVPAE